MFIVGRTVWMSWRVKLEKKLAYKHKEKRHYKHLVAIPEALSGELAGRPVKNWNGSSAVILSS